MTLFTRGKTFKCMLYLMLFAVVISILPIHYSFAYETNEYVVTTDYVNFRKGPSIHEPVINSLSAGTKALVVENSSNDWVKLRLDNGREGYVHSKDLAPFEESTPQPTPTPPPSTPQGFLIVTANSGLNFRTSPNTDAEIIATLAKGTVVVNLGRHDNDWYKVEDSSGTQGYMFAQYLEEYNPEPSDGDIIISSSSVTVKQYMTVYLTAETKNDAKLFWSSDNTAVATVNEGFVYAKSAGTATIKVQDVTGASYGTCKITVIAPEFVRFAYPQNNAPVSNVEFNLAAVTPLETNDVKFDIYVKDGNYISSVNTTTFTTETQTTSGFADNNVKIFTAPVTLSEGTYTIRAYGNDTGDYKEFSVFVGVAPEVYSSQPRQISSEMVKVLANFEGFSPVVYPDRLAYNIPTVGYGKVIYKNNHFYNNLTMTEGFAQLVETVNQKGYTSAMNNMIANDNMLVNQAQFDALVSFTYNIGPGWNNSSYYTKRILLNPAPYDVAFLDGATQPGRCNVPTGVYSEASPDAKLIGNLSDGTTLTATGYFVDSYDGAVWYSITSSAFEGTGWARAGYISLDNYANQPINLKYVDPIAFAYNFTQWNQAGGSAIWGLYLRRMAEAKIFLYGNYAEAYHSHPNYSKNTYNFITTW